MLILSSQIPCVPTKALPVLQLATSSQPWGKWCERGRAVCHPRSPHHMSWHSTAHSYGPFLAFLGFFEQVFQG